MAAVSRLATLSLDDIPWRTNMPRQASLICWFLHPELVDVALVPPPVIHLRFAPHPGPPCSPH
ncbi:hypothetical protein K443DRAFT_685802 [Laccaria amethystina LaAM-08-1]|uniref:Unplaced genomic scaffold K443scaffold_441, whole genome shotgun sequence n=1 Tax=Laccaria amethystina LaAM-08-1 TaxID=1095629 RepID=A0A0C9WTQ0_9AGAR|nr:hypothetical protein K443DRAFT_685802 [Laccaria amethystina LaAM-08-1]